jgi:Methylamine utilisation protein MauE
MGMTDPLFIRTAALALCLVLVAGATSKLANPARFIAELSAYELMPDRWLAPLAWLVMLAEAGAGLLLLMPSTRAAGAALAAALLVAVTGALMLTLARGRAPANCGCGGLGGDLPVSGSLVTRNAVLLGFAGLAAAGELVRDWSMVDTTLAVTGGLSLFLLYAAANRLLANWPALGALRG